MNRLSSAVTAMKSHYDELWWVRATAARLPRAAWRARAAASACSNAGANSWRASIYATRCTAPIRFNTTNTTLLGTGRLAARAARTAHQRRRDVNAVVGCGLGGTSLTNANVALEADARLWDDARRPTALRGDAEGRSQGYALARAMLQPSPVPDDYPPLPKLLALEESAKALGMEDRFCRPPITVTRPSR